MAKKIKEKLEDIDSLKKIEKNLKDEISGITGKTGQVDLPGAQVVKRAAGHYGAWYHGVPDPEFTARQTVYNTFYNKMKTAIEKSAPEGVKENIDLVVAFPGGGGTKDMVTKAKATGIEVISVRIINGKAQCFSSYTKENSVFNNWIKNGSLHDREC